MQNLYLLTYRLCVQLFFGDFTCTIFVRFHSPACGGGAKRVRRSPAVFFCGLLQPEGGGVSNY